MIVKSIPRKFSFKINNTSQTLQDPNPKMTPQEVCNFFSGQYPELTNAEVINNGFDNDHLNFEFKTTFGFKG